MIEKQAIAAEGRSRKELSAEKAAKSRASVAKAKAQTASANISAKAGQVNAAKAVETSDAAKKAVAAFQSARTISPNSRKTFKSDEAYERYLVDNNVKYKDADQDYFKRKAAERDPFGRNDIGSIQNYYKDMVEKYSDKSATERMFADKEQNARVNSDEVAEEIYGLADENGNTISLKDAREEQNRILNDRSSQARDVSEVTMLLQSGSITQEEADARMARITERYAGLGQRQANLGSMALAYNDLDREYSDNIEKMASISKAMAEIEQRYEGNASQEGDDARYSSLNSQKTELQRRNQELETLIKDQEYVQNRNYYDFVKQNGTKEEVSEFESLMESKDDGFAERRIKAYKNTLRKIAVEPVAVIDAVRDFAMSSYGKMIRSNAEKQLDAGMISSKEYNEFLKASEEYISWDPNEDGFSAEERRRIDRIAQETYYGEEGAARMIGQAMDSTGEFLTQALLFNNTPFGFLTKHGRGSLIAMASQSATDTYFNNLRLGYSEQTSMANAIGHGALSYMTERIGMDSFMKTIAGDTIDLALGNAVGYLADSMIKQGTSEGLEEVVEWFFSPIVDYATYGGVNADGTPITLEQLSSMYDLNDAGQSFAVAFLSAAMTGASGGIFATFNQYTAITDGKGMTTLNAIAKELDNRIRSGEFKGDELKAAQTELKKMNAALFNFKGSDPLIDAVSYEDNAKSVIGIEKAIADMLTPDVRKMSETFRSLDSMRAEVSTITNAMLSQNSINVINSYEGTSGADAYLRMSPEARQNAAEGAKLLSSRGVPFVYDASLTISENMKAYGSDLIVTKDGRLARRDENGKIVGVKMVNGYWDRSKGMMVLDPNAKTDATKAMFHEITHTTESTSTYAQLRKQAEKYYGSESALKEAADALKERYSDYMKNEDATYWEKEAVAEAIGDIAQNTNNFTEHLAEYGDDFLHTVLANAKAVFGNQSAQVELALNKALDERFRSRKIKAKDAKGGKQYSISDDFVNDGSFARYNENDIKRMSNSKKILLDGVDLTFEEFVENFANGLYRSDPKELYLGKIGRNIANALINANPNINDPFDYNLVVPSTRMYHMLNEHGIENNETARGQRVADIDDMLYIISVIHDSIPKYIGKNGDGNDTFEYIKETSIGTYHVDASLVNKKFKINFDTMYITTTSEQLAEYKKRVPTLTLSQNKLGSRGKKTDSTFNVPNNSAKSSDGNQLRITPQQDAVYAEAVKTGNSVLAQQMVDEAAKANGYVSAAYHGTNEEFTTFKHIAENKYDNGYLGKGFYFTDNKETASDYADWKSRNKYSAKPRVMNVYLNMDNPLVLGEGPNLSVVQEALGLRLTDNFLARPSEELSEAITNRAIELGYDGIAKETADGTVYVVFDPSQIKSADPVTYDDNGKPIPLSQRFNDNADDIRYRIAENDADMDIMSYIENFGRESLDALIDEVDRNDAKANLKMQEHMEAQGRLDLDALIAETDTRRAASDSMLKQRTEFLAEANRELNPNVEEDGTLGITDKDIESLLSRNGVSEKTFANIESIRSTMVENVDKWVPNADVIKAKYGGAFTKQTLDTAIYEAFAYGDVEPDTRSRMREDLIAQDVEGSLQGLDIDAEVDAVLERMVTDFLTDVLYKQNPYFYNKSGSRIAKAMDAWNHDPLTAEQINEIKNAVKGMEENGEFKANLKEDFKGTAQFISENCNDLSKFGYFGTLEQNLLKMSGYDQKTYARLNADIVRPREKARAQMLALKSWAQDQLNAIRETGITKNTKESQAVQWIMEGHTEKLRTDLKIDGDTTQETLDEYERNPWEKYDEEMLRRDFDYKMPNGKKAYENILDAAEVLRKAYADMIDKVNSSQMDINGTEEAIKGELKVQLNDLKIKADNAMKNMKALRSQMADEGTTPELEAALKKVTRAYNSSIKKYNKLSEGLSDNDAFRRQLTPVRKNYAPHYREQNLRNMLKGVNKENGIPTELAGISSRSRPNTGFASFMIQQGKGEYNADAIKGFERYMDEASRLVAYNPVIVQYRALLKDLREQNLGTTRMSRFTAWLDEYTNTLAGKRTNFNRSTDEQLGVIMRPAKMLTRLGASAALKFNVRSALVQFGNIPNGLGILASQDRKWKSHVYKGVSLWAGDMKNGTRLIDQSPFMASRFFDYDDGDRSFRQKMDNVADFMMTKGDQIAAEMIWYSAYVQSEGNNLGMDSIEYADYVTRSAIAGRDHGDIPIAMQQDIIRFLLPFQIEVNNQWQTMSRFANTKNAKALATIFIASFILNQLFRGIGLPDDPLSDPITPVFNELTGKESVWELLSDISKGEEMGGLIGGETDIGTFMSNVILGEIGEAMSAMPGGSYIGQSLGDSFNEAIGDHSPSRYGSGTFGLTGIGDIFGYMADGNLYSLGEEIASNYLPGGTQAIRTAKGLQSMGALPKPVGKGDNFRWDMSPVNYTSSGKRISFVNDPKNVFDWMKAAAFGKWATGPAQDYIESGFKSASPTASNVFQAMASVDGNASSDLFKEAMSYGQASNESSDKLAESLKERDVFDEYIEQMNRAYEESDKSKTYYQFANTYGLTKKTLAENGYSYSETDNVENQGIFEAYEWNDEQKDSYQKAIDIEPVLNEDGTRVRNSEQLATRRAMEDAGIYDDVIAYISENGIDPADYGLGKQVMSYDSEKFAEEYEKVFGKN